MTIASLRKEIYKMGLEYLVVTEIKEVEKKQKQKRHNNSGMSEKQKG